LGCARYNFILKKVDRLLLVLIMVGAMSIAGVVISKKTQTSLDELRASNIESAIEKGLAFLGKDQLPSGEFKMYVTKRYYSEPGAGI